MNYQLSFYLRSAARLAVLRILFRACRPLGFRDILARESLGIRSVQQEIRTLQKLEIIRCVVSKLSGKPAYEMNRQHEAIPFLNHLLNLEDRFALQARGQHLSSHAVKRLTRLSHFRNQLIAIRRSGRGSSKVS